jgi:uncharacterized protein (DUF1697 family)
MATCIGLLRAVNLGPHNKVSMADLRALLADMGLSNPQTLILSGNVVFGSPAQPGRLERQIERAMDERLGITTDVFVRTAAEWSALIADNPFAAEARRDPGHLLGLLLKDEPTRAAAAALARAIPGRERVTIVGRQAYIVYPDGIGRSRLGMALIERTLGTRGTGRNWNTILKLRQAADERESKIDVRR